MTGRGLTTVLFALLVFGVLTIWAPGRWFLAVFQSGAYGLAAAVLVRQAWRGGPVHWSPAFLGPVVVAAWGLAQLAVGSTVYAWETGNAVQIWTANACLAYVAVQVFQDAGARQLYLRSALWFGFGLCVVSTLQMFTSGGKIFWIFPSGYEDLVLGPFVYRNQYAAFMELMLPLALYRALQEPARRWLYLGMAGTMVASVVAAASRAGTGLMALEIVAVLVAACMRKQVSARVAARSFGQLAAAAAVLVAVVGPGFLWERLRASDPMTLRREMVWSSIDMIRERPLMGFGLGTWPAVYPGYAYYDNGMFVNQAHNDWLQWAAEGGLPIAGVLLAMALAFLPAAVRSMWGIGVVSVFLHALVDYPFQERPALAGWVFVFLGAAVTAARGSKQALKQPDEGGERYGQERGKY